MTGYSQRWDLVRINRLNIRLSTLCSLLSFYCVLMSITRRRSWPSLIYWQWWLSSIRLFAALYTIGLYAWYINYHSLKVMRDSYQFIEVSSVRREPGPFAVWIVPWALVAVNDMYMMTVDLKRTNTYLGCIATQTTINFCAVVLTSLHDLPYTPTPFRIVSDLSELVEFVIFGVSLLLAGLCSLCLMSLGIWLAVSLSYRATMRERWMVNIKDACMGSIPPVTGLLTFTLLGHPREIPIPYPFNRRLVEIVRVLISSIGKILVSFIKKPLGVLFFRRVRPAETRTYAFARNSFAAVAIVALIFRTATAFQQAQNEVGTRVTSSDCGDASPYHDISILLDRLIHDDRWGNASSGNRVIISTFMPDSESGSDCPVFWSQRFNVSETGYPGNQTRVLEFYKCWKSDKILHNVQEYSDITSYRVGVWPIASIPPPMILSGQMPRLWFVNYMEIPFSPNGSLPDSSKLLEIMAYLPPMTLRRGSSIIGKANLITRRFIVSSLVKDVIFNFKPKFSTMSLYPIVESSVTPLDIYRDAIASATVIPTLSPGLMYYRNKETIQGGGAPADDVCDFVEDYRSGTILDVIGSVGGLFALLQAAHLLLFGRPLFWGLVGAKTISPFGLLGQCSSRGFKRRLREEYHIQSTEEGTDTIHIVKFLQDFVIDFGPANLDPKSRVLQQSRPSSPRVEAHEESAAGVQMPLMWGQPESEYSLGEVKSVDDQSYPYKAVRRNSI